jgi:hypothetical protein
MDASCLSDIAILYYRKIVNRKEAARSTWPRGDRRRIEQEPFIGSSQRSNRSADGSRKVSREVNARRERVSVLVSRLTPACP